MPAELRDYLEPRLEGAGTRQKRWSLLAKAALEKIVEEGLRVEGKKQRRKIFFACGEEIIDCYGRILAYAGPFMTKEERAAQGQPDTFNLRMLRSGFAVSNLHNTNLPKVEDLRLAAEAVRNAKKKKLGCWAEKELILHGYEFRALVRMAMGQAGFRYRVADLRPQLEGQPMKYLRAEEYISIPEEYRVFK